MRQSKTCAGPDAGGAVDHVQALVAIKQEPDPKLADLHKDHGRTHEWGKTAIDRVVLASERARQAKRAAGKKGAGEESGPKAKAGKSKRTRWEWR